MVNLIETERKVKKRVNKEREKVREIDKRR